MKRKDSFSVANLVYVVVLCLFALAFVATVVTLVHADKSPEDAMKMCKYIFDNGKAVDTNVRYLYYNSKDDKGESKFYATLTISIVNGIAFPARLDFIQEYWTESHGQTTIIQLIVSDVAPDGTPDRAMVGEIITKDGMLINDTRHQLDTTEMNKQYDRLFNFFLFKFMSVSI